MISREHKRLYLRIAPNGAVPSGEQTQKQAENFLVLSMEATCQLEGLPPLTDEEIRTLISGEAFSDFEREVIALVAEGTPLKRARETVILAHGGHPCEDVSGLNLDE